MTHFASTTVPAVHSDRRSSGRPSHRLTVGTLRDLQRQLLMRDKLRSYGRADAVAAVDDDVQHRLGQLIEHLERARAWRRAMLAAVTVLIALLAAVAGFATFAPPASAAVLTASTPSVVVDAEQETFTLPALATGNARGWHSASLWVAYAGQQGPVQIGAGHGVSSSVTIKARLHADLLEQFGDVPAVVVDDVTGESTPITLQVRRRTRAMLNHAEVRADGTIALGARVTHFSPADGGYISSRLSPVRFQELTPAGWATVATATTTRDGLAGAVVPATPGTHTYRVVRTTGATVTAATSASRRVFVQGNW